MPKRKIPLLRQSIATEVLLPRAPIETMKTIVWRFANSIRPFSWCRERVDVGEGAPRGREPRRQERGRCIGGWKLGFSCTERVIRHEAPKDDVIALLSPTVRPLSANGRLPGGLLSRNGRPRLALLSRRAH